MPNDASRKALRMWTRIGMIGELALFALLASRLLAEVPNRTPEGLQQGATPIVTGDVVRIYDRSYGHDAGAIIRYVAEVRVKTIEKGEGIEAGSLIYVRYFTLDNPLNTTGTSGHRSLPRDGDHVRTYLVRNAPDGSGDENNDGGLNVLFPNGFEQLTKDRSEKDD